MDPSDLTQKASGKNNIPNFNYLNFVQSKKVESALGINSTYNQCNSAVKSRFQDSGEAARSSLPQLADLANTKMPILVWAGDADLKANWVGLYNAMVRMDWYGNKDLKDAKWKNVSMPGGEKAVGQLKNVDSFTFMWAFFFFLSYSPFIGSPFVFVHLGACLMQAMRCQLFNLLSPSRLSGNSCPMGQSRSKTRLELILALLLAINNLVQTTTRTVAPAQTAVTTVPQACMDLLFSHQCWLV
jgi:hypothetical protein